MLFHTIQNAIRAQVEAKELAKQQEKEKQRREDALAEKRFQDERDRLQQEFDNEQKKQKTKELQEQERVERYEIVILRRVYRKLREI